MIAVWKGFCFARELSLNEKYEILRNHEPQAFVTPLVASLTASTRIILSEYVTRHLRLNVPFSLSALVDSLTGCD